MFLCGQFWNIVIILKETREYVRRGKHLLISAYNPEGFVEPPIKDFHNIEKE